MAKSKSDRLSAAAKFISEKPEPAADKPAGSDPERKPAKKDKPDYISLDIRGRKDYLRSMASLQGISVTRYIQGLIDADAEKNAALYEQLQKFKNS